MTTTDNIALQEMIKQAREGVMRGLGDPLQKFYAAGIAGLKLEGQLVREKRAEQYYRDVEELKNYGFASTGPVPDWVAGTRAYQEATFSGMNRYGIGTGTSMATPQVSITTGPVTQMGGTNYVTMSDLQQATSTAARQGANMALSQLQSNPSLRRTIGVAR